MPRNRIIYNAMSLYVGQNDAITGSHSAAGDIKQLSRVQSFNEDFSRNLTQVNQYGNLAAIDRIELEAPTIKASYSYFITDGANEKYIGLNVTTGTGASLVSCVSGFLTKTTDQKNYFLLIADEGNDTVGYKGTKTGVIGLGNSYVTSYEVEAAVGAIPKATVNLEALNIAVYASVDGTQNVPAVFPADGSAVTGKPFLLPASKTSDSSSQITSLQPGDLYFSIPSGVVGVSLSDLKMQNFKLSVPLSRQPIRQLGDKFAFTREIQWPVRATFSIDAELGDLNSATDGYSGNLANVLCDTGVYTIAVGFTKPLCGGTGAQVLRYEFRGAKLMSQKVDTSIGQNAKFSAEFEAQIGAAQDTANGVFISGSYV